MDPRDDRSAGVADAGVAGLVDRAVGLAIANAAAGGFPFGALVVRPADARGAEPVVLATGVNRARRDLDPTAHAETEAIRAACRRLGTLDLDDAIVVSSCEPCPMCQAVCARVGIARVVYAASGLDAESAGFSPRPVAAAMDAAVRAAGAGLVMDHHPTPDARRPFESWLETGRSVVVDGRARPVDELRLAITAEDYDGALAFYRDALGLPVIANWDSPNGRVTVLAAGRATLELVDGAQAAYIDQIEVGRRVAGPIRVALEVEDSAAVAGRLVKAGATMLGDGPVDTPWDDRNVRIAAAADLQLTLFSPI